MKPPSSNSRKQKPPIVIPTIRPTGTGTGLIGIVISAGSDGVGGEVNGVDRGGDVENGGDGGVKGILPTEPGRDGCDGCWENKFGGNEAYVGVVGGGAGGEGRDGGR